MRQERTIQATIFEVFAQHEIGCELKAMSQWLDGQRQLTSLVAGELRAGAFCPARGCTRWRGPASWPGAADRAIAPPAPPAEPRRAATAGS